MPNPPRWQRVISLSEIPNGGFKCVDTGTEPLLICRLHKEAYALLNTCPHQNQRMDKALMFEYEIVCPHHNACFDVRDGSRLSGPSAFPLGGFPCRVISGEVEVDMANLETSMDRHLRASAAVR